MSGLLPNSRRRRPQLPAADATVSAMAQVGRDRAGQRADHEGIILDEDKDLLDRLASGR